ncbi:MAG: glycosyl transferase family 4 [Lysobacterales bacterium]
MLIAAIAAAALGHLGAVAVRALAARGRMLDRPGANRMHAAPIPRGGGAGFAAALLFLGIVPNLAIAQVDRWQLSAGLLAFAVVIVAVVGWLDDHRGLLAWPRFAVHMLAGVCVAMASSAAEPSTSASAIIVGLLIVVVTAASINLHNFFDGADGLLATQALFVLTVLAFLALRGSHMPLALMSVATAGAIAGFLPHNLFAHRSRVFMGDVGSGTLGLAIAAIASLSIRDDLLSLPSVLLLVSGCVIDTGMTLASRVLRGRRFWRRHREHLYQWLIRKGWSHLKVTTTWFVWNLAVVLPAFLYTLRKPEVGWILAAIVYAFGMSIWTFSKRRLRLISRTRGKVAR